MFPQGFLVVPTNIGHSERGGFTIALSVLVNADSSGYAPADSAVAAFSSADGQLSWSLTSNTNGTWSVHLCMTGVCAAVTTVPTRTFSYFRSVAARYRSDVETVEIWVNRGIELSVGGLAAHDLVRLLTDSGQATLCKCNSSSTLRRLLWHEVCMYVCMLTWPSTRTLTPPTKLDKVTANAQKPWLRWLLIAQQCSCSGGGKCACVSPPQQGTHVLHLTCL